MTTADKITTTGIVVDRNHKDGISAQGKKWDRYGFQIAAKDGKHWYTSFDTVAWTELEKGQCFEVYYSEKENPQGGAPFRNLEWWHKVELPASTAQEAAEAVTAATRENENRRSAQEMRWTEALGMATQLVTIGILDDEAARRAILGLGMWYYEQLEAGPYPAMPQDGATIDAEPPAEPEPPPTSAAPVTGDRGGWGGLLSRCRIAEHGGQVLMLVAGDARPKHPVHIVVDGKRILDRWCYGT